MFKVKFNFFDKNILDYIIIVLFPLVILWKTFMTKGVINNLDADTPLFPLESASKSFFLWDSQWMTGVNTVLARFLMLPRQLFFALFCALGVPIDISVKLYLLFILLIMSLGMYKFTYFISPTYDLFSKRIASLSASLIFIYNLYTYERLRLGQAEYLVDLAFMPLAFYLVISGIQNMGSNKRGAIKRSIMLSILSLLLFAGNYAIVALRISALIFIFMSAIIFESHNEKRLSIFKFFLITFMLIFLTNAWWEIPSVHSYFSGELISHVNAPEFGWKYFLEYLSSETNILRASWLAWPAFYNEWSFWFEGSMVYSWYRSIFVTVTLTMLEIVPGFAILSNRKNWIIISLAMLLVVSLGFSAGLNNPITGRIYSFLLEKFPPFRVFRDPFLFTHTTVFAFSPLFGIGLVTLVKFLFKTKICKTLTTVIILSVILVTVYPLLSGDCMGYLTPISIPNFYYQSKNWIDKKATFFRIIVMPQVWWYERYWWGPDLYENMVPLPVNIFSKPVLMSWVGNWIYDPSSFKLTMLTSTLIERGEVSQAIKVAQLLSVRYLLVRDDLVNPWKRNKEIINSSSIYTILDNQSGVQLEKSFDKLHFYEIRDENYIPFIHSVSNVFLINGDVDEFSGFISSSNFTAKDTAIFFSDQINTGQWQFLKNYQKKNAAAFTNDRNVPRIIFKRLNPTKYQVEIENAFQPFFLILSESYNPGWKAYVEDRSVKFSEPIVEYPYVNVKEVMNDRYRFTPEDLLFLFSEPLDENYHFKANGYANAWYIDPKEIDKDRDGNFTITLYFWPQSLFYLGLIVSGLTLIVCTGYLAYNWKYRRC